RFSRDWSSDVCSSDLDLVGYLDPIAEIRTGGGARTAKRIEVTRRAISVAGRAFAFSLALLVAHALHHLVHHVLGALAQRLQRPRSEERRGGEACDSRE